MIERVEVDLRGLAAFAGAVFRYDLVDRVRRCCEAHGVGFVAFGFTAAGHLRLALAGDPAAVREVLRGTKVGTHRVAAGMGTRVAVGHHRSPPAPAIDAVCWAHDAPGDARGPLATPWTSHRDLLAFRFAAFYDAGVARGLVDPREVHRRLGGGALPDGWPPSHRPAQDVSLLLRVSAAVLGVLPADRRCFRMFCHLAKATGLTTDQAARALSVTGRRVRQLRAEPEPLLPLALLSLGHPALSRVP